MNLIFKTILVTLFMVVTSADLTHSSSTVLDNGEIDECEELGANCHATANQEYENGNYSFEVWYMFVYDICPTAQLDCIFDRYE